MLHYNDFANWPEDEKIEELNTVARFVTLNGVSKEDMHELIRFARERIQQPNAVWTPCEKGLPKSDGFYMATIRLDNILQHREYEKRVEFDRGQWCGISSDMKVIAWREESPYNPNKAQEA